VLVCGHCGTAYPIVGGLTELVIPVLQDADSRRALITRFGSRLDSLGVRIAEPDTANNDAAVAAQIKQRQHFDWYAENQSQSYQEYQNTPFWRAADEQTLRRWRPLVADGSVILDVGCADGRGGFYFTSLPDATLIGFDISRKMVANAIRRAKAEGFYDRSSFLVADATRLPFATGTFDVVITFGVLHHLPEPAAAMQALQHVLKIGGVHLALENNTSVMRPLFDFLMKLRPLWSEEAGDEPLISPSMVREWLSGVPAELTYATYVFVPPHVLNWFGRTAADRLLRITDAIGRAVPVVRDNGGLIVFEARKRA
jgi:ubiquinone/menaquinone biosynthesis C-methylase UbiE